MRGELELAYRVPVNPVENDSFREEMAELERLAEERNPTDHKKLEVSGGIEDNSLSNYMAKFRRPDFPPYHLSYTRKELSPSQQWCVGLAVLKDSFVEVYDLRNSRPTLSTNVPNTVIEGVKGVKQIMCEILFNINGNVADTVATEYQNVMWT